MRGIEVDTDHLEPLAVQMKVVESRVAPDIQDAEPSVYRPQENPYQVEPPDAGARDFPLAVLLVHDGRVKRVPSLSRHFPIELRG